jgi:hypothetical protein
VSAPRRYRAALRAYPAGYRASRGPELLATLSDGDDDRGAPSLREALSLAGAGFRMRLRMAVSADGMLTASALLVVAALTCGYDWAERVFLLRGETAASGSDGPAWWWALALALAAYVTLAAGPLRACEDRRRRAWAAALAVPYALVVFAPPGPFVSAGALREYVGLMPPAVFHNWHMTLPAALLAPLVTWAALGLLGRRGQPARRRLLAVALGALAAAAFVQTARRPDLPAEYARGALADLRPAAFLAAAGALLATVAALRPTRAR